MKEVKPILIARIADKHRIVTEDEFNSIVKTIKRRTGNEYHVLVLLDAKIESPNFEVFYDKDVKQTDIEELKDIVLKSIEQ